MNSVEIWRSYW